MVPNPDGSGLMPSGHLEWQKLQNQFYDSTKMKEGPRQAPPANSSGGPVLSPQVGPTNGPRLQGPPPPYHQTPRSASVPIALQSPSPASPNNPTSNLSLPSPRTSSALNSPADSNRQQQTPFTGINNRHFNATQSPTSQSSPSAAPARVPATVGNSGGGGGGGNTMSNPGTPISSHFSPNASTPATDSMTTQPGGPTTGPPNEFSGNTPAVTSAHHGGKYQYFI